MKTKRILPWRRWTEEKPTVPGEYWLAYFEPPDEECPDYKQKEPQEPTMWEVCEDYINGNYNIEFVMNWPEENIIWFGPLTPPPFSGKKK